MVSLQHSNILVVGAASAIAQETAKLFASEGARFLLAGRVEEKLRAVGDDLLVRGASGVETYDLDLLDFDEHGSLIQKAAEYLERIDYALITHGYLGNQELANSDFGEANRILRTNYASVVSILLPLVQVLKKQEYGCLAVVSSVAGDRGRPSNYTYGSAKAALSTYLQGLRAALFKKGISVITVKPGWVATPMTRAIKPNPLMVSPQRAGRAIYRGIRKKRDILYVPGFWRWILAVVKAIPERIFKRLSL